jgi:hypothetical protein
VTSLFNPVFKTGSFLFGLQVTNTSIFCHNISYGEWRIPILQRDVMTFGRGQSASGKSND